MTTIKSADAGRGAAWLTEGFGYFTRHAGVWIGMAIILLIICVILSLIPFLGGLVLALLMPVFTGGVILGCRDMDRGGSLVLNHLFAGFSNNTGQLVLIGLLEFVAMIAIIVITMIIGAVFMGGMGTMMQFMQGAESGNPAMAAGMGLGMLLVMLIFLALYVPVLMAVWFAPALVVLDGMPAVDAMVSSFKGCLKNIVPFLIYGLLGLILAIIASIPLMLGWLVLFPVLLASIYLGYKDIFETEQVEPQAP